MTAVEATPLSLPQSSLIKMEDRKRPAHDQNDAAHPPKRQATTNGASKTHVDSDMPWKDDLERFQKDAIHRQMQEYKREKNSLETALKEMRKKARDHDDHLRAIDSWWKQLIDEVKLVIQADDDDVEMDHSEIPSSLLFSDQKTFEKHLQGRADDIRSIMSRIFSKNKGTTPEVLLLQGRISKLLAAEKVHTAELEKLGSDVRDLDERLENAIMRYMLAEKKLDRAKSVTAAKLETGLLLGGAGKSSDDSGHTKREDGTTNGATDQTEEVAELEQEVKKNQAAAEKQKEQISKLEEEQTKLTSRLTELSTKTAILSDDDYAKTELYKQLKLQHDDVVNRINDLEATNAELREENNRILTERTTYQTQLETENRNAISEKDALLGRAEIDLARIRSSRDEILADLNINRSRQDQEKESLTKIKDLASAQDDRIKALESENERLAAQTSSLMEISDLEGLSTEELRSNYHELKTKYELLTGELTSMQTAFQKTSKLANQKVSEFAALEEKVARLAAEKSKADQKYFGAMKSKETRDGELRTLRLQNTKSSEVVSQLKEAEAASRSLVANLEKQVAELKSAVVSKTAEHRTASQQSTTSSLEVSRLTSQLNELKSQLVLKDAKLATTSSACRTAEVEVEELKVSVAETRKQLESWKSKSGQSEQYEMLRMIAYCNICKKRLKDTALLLCGHTFCGECVQERYESRARKCPNCSRAFGQKDFMKITL